MKKVFAGILSAMFVTVIFSQSVMAQSSYSSSGDAAGSGFALIICFMYLAVCAVTIILPIVAIALICWLAYWVYNDATQRGNPNAALWAVLILFTNVTGLLIYMLVGREQT